MISFDRAFFKHRIMNILNFNISNDYFTRRILLLVFAILFLLISATFSIYTAIFTLSEILPQSLFIVAVLVAVLIDLIKTLSLSALFNDFFKPINGKKYLDLIVILFLVGSMGASLFLSLYGNGMIKEIQQTKNSIAAISQDTTASSINISTIVVDDKESRNQRKIIEAQKETNKQILEAEKLNAEKAAAAEKDKKDIAELQNKSEESKSDLMFILLLANDVLIVVWNFCISYILSKRNVTETEAETIPTQAEQLPQATPTPPQAEQLPQIQPQTPQAAPQANERIIIQPFKRNVTDDNDNNSVNTIVCANRNCSNTFIKKGRKVYCSSACRVSEFAMKKADD